jgi:hypothetical protein
VFVHACARLIAWGRSAAHEESSPWGQRLANAIESLGLTNMNMGTLLIHKAPAEAAPEARAGMVRTRARGRPARRAPCDEDARAAFCVCICL